MPSADSDNYGLIRQEDNGWVTRIIALTSSSSLGVGNQGSVNYEGLQTELNHRSRGGLTLQASQVWAKSLGNVAGDAPTAFSSEVIYGTPVANRFDLAANQGNIAAVRRNRYWSRRSTTFPSAARGISSTT